ncbi:MAG: hypothetical protein ACRC36_00170 [Lacrimispora sphenoides]
MDINRSVAIKTWEDMKQKYPLYSPDSTLSRADMTEDEEKEFVSDCYLVYENEGFSKVFCSPFDGCQQYNGRKFEVLGRIKPLDEDENNGGDLEVLPLWNIMLETGEIVNAYPEEIIPSEIKENMWRATDKQYLEIL